MWFPPPSPAYFSYRSCWGSLRTSSKVVCMRSMFTIYSCYIQFQLMLVILCTYILSWNLIKYSPPPHLTLPYLKINPQNESRFWNKKCLDQQQIHDYLTLTFIFSFLLTGPYMGRGRGPERLLGEIFTGYVPLASQSPYPIIVYSVTNYRPHLGPFWANM